jgi:hypothetical protein
MGTTYTAGDNDCISSIAQDNGFFWQTIWNHPQNADLKALRKDPNVLMAGDAVFIPDLTVKGVAGGSGARHTFKLRGVPAIARFRFLEAGKPRAGVPYVLNVGDLSTNGQTDGDGCVQFPIPPNVTTGTLFLGQGAKARRYDLQFGAINPVTEESGARQRLTTLGFDCGDDGDADRLARAIRSFQVAKTLQVTGLLDEPTRDALVKAYGC